LLVWSVSLRVALTGQVLPGFPLLRCVLVRIFNVAFRDQGESEICGRSN
jgi:hypothetical protein